MVLKADRERVKALLTETITLLCKNGLNYQSEFAIEALIGITLDRDDVFLVSIKETICSDLGIDKGYDLHDDSRDDRRGDRREFHVETTRTSRIEATRISQEDLKDGLESAPDLSIMIQLDKSDDGRLEDTQNGSSALVPQKLFRSMHADTSSMDMVDTQASQATDPTPSSLTFGMRDFDTGTSTTGGGDTSWREHSAGRSDHKHSADRADHIRQPAIKRQRTVDSGDWSVKEEEDSDDDVVVIKEEAGLDTLSCQMDAYNRTGMFDTSGSVSHDAISGMTAAANVLPHTLTLSSSAPAFPGCSSWDQLPAISAQHSLPPSTASSNTTMSNTPSQQMSQSVLSHEGTVKRPRKLSIEDRLKIIERLEEGATHGTVAKEFAIGKSTVGDIKKKNDQGRLFKTMPANRAWQNSQVYNTKSTKRSLTIHDKLEIIRLADSGEKKQVRIAEQFGIARSTVTAVKLKRDKYLSFLNLNRTPSAMSHRTLHQPKDMAHQQAVYQWYLDQVNSGHAVSNEGLLGQATVLHQELHGSEPDYDPEVFQRGIKQGWVVRFKKRFEIY